MGASQSSSLLGGSAAEEGGIVTVHDGTQPQQDINADPLMQQLLQLKQVGHRKVACKHSCPANRAVDEVEDWGAGTAHLP